MVGWGSIYIISYSWVPDFLSPVLDKQQILKKAHKINLSIQSVK